MGRTGTMKRTTSTPCLRCWELTFHPPEIQTCISTTWSRKVSTGWRASKPSSFLAAMHGSVCISSSSQKYCGDWSRCVCNRQSWIRKIQKVYKKALPFLGVNCKIKQEWRTLPEMYQGLVLPNFPLVALAKKVSFLLGKGGLLARHQMTRYQWLTRTL
jgi:hypothetical protein